MQKALDPLSVERTRTPSASYVLRRRYGPARHIIAVASWITVINLLLQPVAVLAATISWDGDTNATWTDGNNWIGGNAPANSLVTDTASFNTGPYNDSTIWNPNAGTVSIGGITIGASNGAMTLNGTTLLSIGAGGITIANGAGAFTLSSPITLGSAQTWANNSVTVFAVNPGTLTRSAGVTLNFTNAGGGGFTTTTLGNSNGILGPWVTYAGNDYAKNDGSGPPGNIVALAATAAGNDTGWSTDHTTGTLNPALSGPATLSASRDIHTLRYTGNAQILSTGTGAFGLTTDGVLNGGTGLLTIQRGTGGTGNLTIGASGELVIAGSQSVTVKLPITGTGNLIKAGAGTLTIDTNASSFIGTTYVTGGTMSLGIASALGTSNPTVMSGGTLTATIANALSGRTVTVNEGGTLQVIRTNAATLTIGGNVQVLGNSTIDLQTVSQNCVVTFGTIDFGGGGGSPFTLTTTRTFGTYVDTAKFVNSTIANDGIFNVGASTPVELNGLTLGSGRTLTKSTGTGTMTISGSNAATIALGANVIANAGTLNLSTTSGSAGAGTYTANSGATVSINITNPAATFVANNNGTVLINNTLNTIDFVAGSTFQVNTGAKLSHNRGNNNAVTTGGNVQVLGNATLELQTPTAGSQNCVVTFGTINFGGGAGSPFTLTTTRTGSYTDTAKFVNSTIENDSIFDVGASTGVELNGLTLGSGRTLTKSTGTGTMTISGSNAATIASGANVIANAGTLNLSTTSGSAGAGTYTANSGATVSINITNPAATFVANNNGTVLINNTALTANFVAGSTFQLNTGAKLSHNRGNSGTLTTGGNVQVLGNATLELQTANQGCVVTFGSISFGGGAGSPFTLTTTRTGSFTDTAAFAGSTLANDGNFNLGANTHLLLTSLTFAANRVIGIDGAAGTTATFRGALSGGTNTLTIQGNVPGVTFGDSTGAVTGTSGGVAYNGSGAITVAGASTFTGGFALNSGTLLIGASSAVGGGVITSGPFGTGSLTVSGGTLKTDATVKTVHNDLNITGNFTFSAASGANNLTFDPTTRTSPGTITVTGARTVTLLGNTLTLTGPITGSGTPGLTAVGPGTLAFVNASGTPSSQGPIVVGDGATFSGNGVGGVISVSSQNALGTGAITIKYGGSLFESSAGFNPTNIITVNAGGTFGQSVDNGSPVYGVTAGTLIVRSMATLSQANNGEFRVSGNTFPTSGVLMVFNGKNYLSIGNTTQTQPYPTLTGTMVFSQVSTAAAQGVKLGALNTGTAQTIAFNNAAASNPGGFLFNGTTLGANLTIAGSGNTGLTGMVPTGAAGALGNVNDAYTVTVNMAPAGAVSFTSGTTKLTTLTVNSGTAIVSTDLGSATAQLNGGVIRLGTAISSNINVGANGGVLETASALSYTGSLTATVGAANLVLRSVNAALTIATGNNTGLNTGIILATAGTPASIYFNGSATQLPNTGYNISIPDGIAFGGTAVVNANKTRFVPIGVNAIYDAGTTAGPSVSLAFAGLDNDFWVGLNNNVNALVGYTLRTSGSYQNDYRIVPIAASTINQGNVLNNTGTYNLTVSAGAVPTHWASSPTTVLGAGITLTISASQNYTGSTLVTGVVKNALMGGGAQGPTLALTSTLSTTAINLTRGGLMNVTGASGAVGSATAINVMGSSIFTSGDASTGNASRLNDSAAIALGGTDGGGTLTMVNSAAATEDVLSLAVDKGGNAIGASGNLTLRFIGAAGTVYTRYAGGVVNFNNATTKVIFQNAPTTASSTAVGGVGDRILIGAFLNNADFVKSVAGGTQIVAPIPTTAANIAAIGTVDDNILLTAGGTGTSTVGTINSLKITTAAPTITVGGTLNIRSGMILNTVANTAINGGTALTTGGSDYIVNSSVAMSIGSAMTGAVPLTTTGGGTLTLSSTGNLFTHIYVNGGKLTSSDGFRPLGDLSVAKTVNIFGGTLSVANSATPAYNTAANMNLVVGPQTGSALQVTGAGPFTIGTTGVTTMTLNGNLQLQPHWGNLLVLNSDITGAGTFTTSSQNSAQQYGIVQFGGNNSGWTGGIANTVNMVVHLWFASANATGSGPIVLNSGSRGVAFTSTAGATYANDFVINNSGLGYLQNWKTNGALSLTGRIVGTAGLLLQGYDAGSGNVSETVLAGTVSMSGTPTVYSYGGSTGLQRFVNAQGGVTLGATDYTTVTTSVNLGNGGALPAFESVTTAWTAGAEGYVRFAPDASGRVNSLIPGAVGPGYVAAIRKGGATALNFGYLLTGTSGAGTTYTLPEGKSFVIGSLGSGTQVGGTLGVAGGGVATFLGNRKLAGAECGDINVHANAADSVQTNYFLARASADVLKMGNSTTNVVICPTYGDSGATSAITLMRDRTGGTGLTKLGVGTQEVVNVGYSNVAHSASVRNTFTWNVNAGTLMYYQFDGAEANFAGFNVNSGGTLGGTGKVNSAVSVVAGGTVALGTNTTFEVASLNMATNSYFRADVANLGVCGKLTVGASGSVALNGAELTMTGEPTLLPMTLIDNKGAGQVTGTFSNLPERATFLIGTKLCRITYAGGDGNDVMIQNALGGTVILFR